MPLGRRRPVNPHPQADDLRRRLIDEWRHPQSIRTEPVIIPEGDAPDRPTHLYVVWSDWSDLSQQERSEIIMDAYEEVSGHEAVLTVTVAMGLTPDDARRLGIGWERVN